ncbi:hypothetical protein CYMTET_20805 [Cymbomonas tetramitiformis]|uniref:Uncharacterized protein n=1 Tax=Cymbomonas tetramitiformis TaxID=36881 RepID=A0AAE0L3W3_9CHLO|nr:hypothetical protein CYMTET_20805 [Cymbomonas tetramitiformis]
MSKVCDHCGEPEGADALKVAAWKTHKKECKRISAQKQGSALPDSEAELRKGWANGLSRDDRYEWLTDCFRMRMDDLYCWGGGELRGVMDPEATPKSVSEEFWIFSKLAVKNKVLPEVWDWKAFLTKASGLVPYAFEKADAKEKYGRENVFSGMLGGRSLRCTGELIYGSSVMGYNPSPDESAFFNAIAETELFEHDEEGSTHEEDDDDRANACADVGGLEVWLNFCEELTKNPGPNIHQSDL